MVVLLVELPYIISNIFSKYLGGKVYVKHHSCYMLDKERFWNLFLCKTLHVLK